MLIKNLWSFFFFFNLDCPFVILLCFIKFRVDFQSSRITLITQFLLAMTGFFGSVWRFSSCVYLVSLSSFSLVFCAHSFLSLSVCEPSAWVQPLLFSVLFPHLSSFGSGRNSPLPPSFPSDGGILVQTRAAQRLVDRAGQCGALGGCVSLSPHLWDGLRLSVVSTPPAPPSEQDHVMKLMSNKIQNKGKSDSSPKIMWLVDAHMGDFPLFNTVN